MRKHYAQFRGKSSYELVLRTAWSSRKVQRCNLQPTTVNLPESFINEQQKEMPFKAIVQSIKSVQDHMFSE
jgi:hypothetical protein